MNDKKTCQLPHISNIVCHKFQYDIVQKAYVKIHLNYVSLQCSCKYTSTSFAVKPIETNRPSLLWVEFGICIGRESSNALNKICLFQKWTLSLWYSLITALTFWKRIPLALDNINGCVQLNWIKAETTFVIS